MARKYDHEFKEYIAKLVVDEGNKATDVAREMDISPKTISRWVRDYRNKIKLNQEEISYITPSEYRKREKELLDQINNLKEENEIIKKAAHIFMQSQK
ncbi:transposase [Alkalihalobacillus sp. MEB203]|uniref:Transposase n=1 Tax=Alkalihalobacterium chitinilyticum TaxID=2980103 RepID=A0ABT5VE68_9BACI|nr:transposase [Alkalihalobacterium chitinilyticum]MDE5413765.1 transposase [Alkalihalobacterium chitinilyticum]